MENNENISGTVENEVSETATKAPAAEKKPSGKKGGASNIIRTVILVICIGVFAFSAIKIVSDLLDDSDTADEVDNLHELAGRDDPENNNVNEDPKDPENNPPVDPQNPDDSQGSDEPSDPGNTNTPDDPTTPDDPADPDDPDNNPTNVEPDPTEDPDPSENQGNTGTQQLPTEYDDQTAEQEKQEEAANPDKVVVVSRPNASLDKTDLSVIHPDNISLEDVAFLSVDLKNVISRNSDTVGWICIPGNDSITGLPVDTAIVQAKNNEYYLNHSFDKTENVNGWIYADYRNNMEKITANYNTIIYGHARSYRMFGGLKNLGDTPEWYKNGYNHFIKITTPNDETIWQIFSWYETSVYYNYIQTSFENSQEFVDFAYEVQSKNELKGYFSTFDFDANSRILTLSTCKGSNPANRVAVHAVLVARNPLN